jgi:cell wall-associated NlpC family hydrolase
MTELAVAVPVSTLWSAPNAPREIDAPAISATPDISAWYEAMNTEDRLGLHGRTLSQLLMGEPVQVTEEADGWVRVKAPWQPSSAGLPAVTGEAALTSARRMLGIGYLWDGTSGWGVDCSGLVHLAFRGHGWVVPREAHDQQSAATEVAPDRARPGDLYFFGATGEASHVGLFSGDDQMLHAPQTGELVEEETLDPDRLRSLTGVGRFGSGGGAQSVKTR